MPPAAPSKEAIDLSWLIDGITGDDRTFASPNAQKSAKRAKTLRKEQRRAGAVLSAAIGQSLPLGKCITSRRLNSLRQLHHEKNTHGIQAGFAQKRRKKIIRQAQFQLRQCGSHPNDESRKLVDFLHHAVPCRPTPSHNRLDLSVDRNKLKSSVLAGFFEKRMLSWGYFCEYIAVMGAKYAFDAFQMVTLSLLDGAICIVDGRAGFIVRDHFDSLVVEIPHSGNDSHGDSTPRFITLDKNSQGSIEICLPDAKWTANPKSTLRRIESPFGRENVLENGKINSLRVCGIQIKRRNLARVASFMPCPENSPTVIAQP